MDTEFVAVKEHVPFLQVNTTAAKEHVDKIECEIRTIKEQTRCISGEFSFQIIPTMVLTYTVYNVAL